jgi:hypothetical protein
VLNLKTLAVACVTSIVWTSVAFAQCPECALYPDRDPLNGGVETPAAKMGLGLSGGGGRTLYGGNANAYYAVPGHSLLQSNGPQARSRKVHIHHQ